MDNDKVDGFEDLFEPFELDEGPPEPGDEESAPAPALSMDDAPMVSCPSCGTTNPAHNRHCESCGARVSQGPLPVSPQPMLRTTAGARALMVLAAVILAVALIALLVNIFNGGSDNPSAGTTADTTGASTIPSQAIVELQVTDVRASSQIPGFPASALIDSDPENSWNDTQLSGQAFLTFTFAQPVQITQIQLQNITDEERFHRNFRIRDYQIEIDDLPTVTSGTLEDDNSAQAITVPSLQTTEITIKVINTYTAEPYEGRLPFRELALQEVKFFGRVVESS
ncbi:MAG: discoidin domain-containing protein [Acidimicrobiia bacterium]